MVLLSWGSCSTKAPALTIKLCRLTHLVKLLSVIKVLTESHRSGRDMRAARHRLAPPAMLADDSWATGKWQKKKKAACSCELESMNHCCSFCFWHSNRQFISYPVIVIMMPMSVLRLLIRYLSPALFPLSFSNVSSVLILLNFENVVKVVFFPSAVNYHWPCAFGFCMWACVRLAV